VTQGTKKARESRRDASIRHDVELPDGVTTADWGLERVRVQNPSIRCYLGCIRLTEEVLDSNYAILHCSPERLLKIWRQVDEVYKLMHSELLPTLREASVIPSLGEARAHAEAAFRALAATMPAALQKYDPSLTAEQLSEVRKLLCVAIGRLYAFLRDTFGEIVANDPRSRHDADYFLSRRFAQDIEESEWLYSAVYELDDLLSGLEKACTASFSDLVSRMRQERMVPPEPIWEMPRKLLETLLEDLLPKLKEVLSLRSIRVNDMEALDAHASKITNDCRSVLELSGLGREVIEQLKVVGGTSLQERERRVDSLIACHQVVSARLCERLVRLQSSLRDLARHIAGAKIGIERRRSLMLAKDLAEYRPRAEKPARRIR
jgi:hypothetical protein